MRTLIEKDVKVAVADTVNDIIERHKGEPDISRDDVIDRLYEDTDELFGQLVRHGRIDQYDVDDLIATAQPCATILKVANDAGVVEDDHGLWEGLTYGVLASIAYFSLEHLVYEGLKAKGYDMNDDHPFETAADVDEAPRA